MAKQPAIMLYTGDWLKDPRLSLCSPATRGVWIDLICAMHEADRSGQLRGTTDQLARVARCSTVELDHALTDLQATGAADVRNRNGVVTVTNRRMKREADERKAARERQMRYRQNNRDPDVTELSQDSSLFYEGEVDNESDGQRSRKGGAGGKPADALIGGPLDTPEFRQAWSEWVQHRHEIRKKLTPTAVSRQVKKLEEMGHDRAIAAIEHSITQGWTGIFEPSERKGSGKSDSQARPGEVARRTQDRPGRYRRKPKRS